MRAHGRQFGVTLVLSRSAVLRLVVATLAVTSGIASANAQAATGVGLAPRPLPAPSITSPQFAGTAFNLVALPNGQLLVNDTRNHRVMLSDSVLRQTTVVIDSIEYGSRPASLMPYLGDSVMFVEGVTPSMTLIDPTGKVVRSMAVPNARDAASLMPALRGMAGIDARGWFVHRGAAPRVALPSIKPGEVRSRSYPDSDPIVRDNPATHAADTITWTQSATLKTIEVSGADGRSKSYLKPTPIAIIDEWAVLSSGRVAVLRGRDYHVDLFDANGTATALPRIPFPWQRLTDEAKAALADSINRARDEATKAPPRALSAAGSSASGGGGGGAGGGAGGGGGGGGGMTGTPQSSGNFPPPPPGSLDVKPSDLPDYHAVFLTTAIHPDAEDNIWVRTTQAIADSNKIVYDVVSNAGLLIDRIMMPKDRTIIGFDKRGNIFLVGKADGGIQWIERVRWKK